MSEVEIAVKSAEAEAAKVETEVKTEVENVEAKVETEVAKVEPEVKTEEKAAEAEVNKVDLAAKKFTEEAKVVITDAENLILTRMENEFLKAQMEIRRLNELAQNIQKQFPAKVEELQRKYLINPATHVFNQIEGAFVKKQ